MGELEAEQKQKQMGSSWASSLQVGPHSWHFLTLHPVNQSIIVQINRIRPVTGVSSPQATGPLLSGIIVQIKVITLVLVNVKVGKVHGIAQNAANATKASHELGAFLAAVCHDFEGSSKRLILVGQIL